MQFPIVLEYKKDILQKNPENFIQGEPVTIKTGIYDRVFAPRHPPFFVNTLVITTTSGVPLDLNKDYEIFNIMPKLTGEAGQPVSCLIKMLNPLIKEVVVDYHTVGSMTLVDSSLLGLFISVLNDDRPISFDNIINKPLGFVPNLHGHSLLYEIFAFQDTVDFLSGLLQLIKDKPDAMKIRLDHYLTLIDWYIDLYGGMLNKYLDLHAKTYDSHGLTAKQVALDLVDNYETATAANILQVRNDQHLKPTELKTLIESYSFNTDEFLPARVLPVAQFGTSNFIPPNIDGSFEGLGGVIETAGICMESDTSIVFLANRMDGRVRGLYYSTLTDSQSDSKVKLTYTGYKYTHPKFVQDGITPDIIATGSGGEAILVGDSARDLFYVGLTNGSLDPTKHVYSAINLRLLVDSIFLNNAQILTSYLKPYLAVSLIGDWVYIILSSPTNYPFEGNYFDGPLIYKQFYRVSVADVKLGNPLVPTRQNISYTNADGEQFNNVPFFKWYSVQKDGQGRVTKGLMTFNPVPSTFFPGNYRSQLVYCAEDPNRKGVFGLKFMSSYYAGSTNKSLNIIPEIVYDFNPVTGVMTLKAKTDLPTNINWNDTVPLPVRFEHDRRLGVMAYGYQAQGGVILEDGRVIASGANGFTGYPRVCYTATINDSNSRYGSVTRIWNSPNQVRSGQTVLEDANSPLESSTSVKGLLYFAGSEYYLAGQKGNDTVNGLYKKVVSGKFALRPEVTNLYIPNVRSRPLSSNVRKINAITGLGGITVTVPSTQLDSFAIEVAESSLSMAATRRFYNRNVAGNGWTPYPANADDILVVARHTERNDPDGTITIVPTAEILYPDAMVKQFKNLVEFPAIKNASPEVIVTVVDPSLSGHERFGWLPVMVSVVYRGGGNLYSTFFVINPTHVDKGNGRFEVSRFNVVNIVHFTDLNAATEALGIFNGVNNNIPAQTFVGPMRVYYYVEGPRLTVQFVNGVIGQTIADSLICSMKAVYNDKTTFQWNTVEKVITSSPNSSFALTPDNGISSLAPWDTTTGGAASLTVGNSYPALLGSVYPEIGWTIFFKSEMRVVFNGTPYTLKAGNIDLRDTNTDPQNKTFYIYAKLISGEASYELSLEKRLETNFQLWIGTVVTNDRQIITLDRFNVTAIDGHRVSETRRGNSIPASSGLIGAEGQLPWLKNNEFLP